MPCPAAAAIASDRRRVAVPEVGPGDEVDMGETGEILSFSFQRLPALVSRRFRQLDDGAAQPFEDFGSVRRRAVAQEHESAAGRRVREMIVEQAQVLVGRRQRRTARRAVQRTRERTEQLRSSMSVRWLGSHRPGEAGRRPCHAPRRSCGASRDRTPRAALQPDFEFGECLGLPWFSRSVSSPVKVARDRNASAASPPLKAANVRRASAVGRGISERDKPVEGCDADMGMMLWFHANILPCAWSILFSPSRPSVVPKSVPGTAFCHEIGGQEAPQI